MYVFLSHGSRFPTMHVRHIHSLCKLFINFGHLWHFADMTSSIKSHNHDDLHSPNVHAFRNCLQGDVNTRVPLRLEFDHVTWGILTLTAPLHSISFSRGDPRGKVCYGNTGFINNTIYFSQTRSHHRGLLWLLRIFRFIFACLVF